LRPRGATRAKQFLDIMRNAGISGAEIDLTARKNPAALLGLE
jgi:hypothetical protein